MSASSHWLNLIGILAFLWATPAFAQSLRVTGFEDFGFGTWTGSGGVTVTDGTLCVYRSTGGKNYNVTASGSGSGGAFAVQNGSSNLAYSVAWKKASGTTGSFTTLTANSATTFSNANNTSQTCGGSYNAALRVTFSDTDLGAAKAGSYSGTLTILIEP